MKRFPLIACMLVCALAGLVGCSSVDPNAVKYRVRIEGADDGKVKKSVKETALTYKLRKRPPATLGQLKRRMDKDVPRIGAILESRGYYDGRVSVEVDSTSDPLEALIRVEQGEQYRFGEVSVLFPGNTDEALETIRPRIRTHQRVVADAVFDEQKRIIEQMNRRGYPFAKLVRRKVDVDREHQTVDLTLEFDPGRLAFFGPVQVEGLTELKPSYIRRQLPWREGRRYDSRQVRDFETKLLGSGLFGSARVEPVEVPNGTNAIPIRVAVNERDKRTLRLGVNYSDVGPGAKAFWEHRNFFGGGERLETSLGWTPIETDWESKLTRTGFLDANQSLVLDVVASVENPEAYDAKRVKGSAMVLHDFTPKIQAGAGTGYNYSLVEQFNEKARFAYVFFPVQLMLDYRDDRLNPQRGFQAFGRTTYNADTLGQQSFQKSYLEGRHYLMVWDRYRVSTALRVTLGSIDGASIGSVPANDRFYAGGGGSVRGYEYQAIGPKLDGKPTGGSRLAEFSAELRVQPGNRLGYVLFADGGTVYNNLVTGDANHDLNYGAGFGLRWFTTIGPLRADIAYPINPDSTQVERLQFYISLGQAF